MKQLSATVQQYHLCDQFDSGYYQDGYLYDVTLSPYYTWNEGRQYCQSRGGDLAYHGMDSLTTRQ